MKTSRDLTYKKLVHRLYEKHPYPAADDRSLKDQRWALAPMEWINVLWKTGREDSSPLRVLVAGCGTGGEAFRLWRKHPQAKIVAIDFSPRSIRIAKGLQQRARKMRNIHFLTADLADSKLGKLIGRDFDFITCHGVLSYLPAPGLILQNLARCLKPDGALYLGVNGERHHSVTLRQALPAFGFSMTEMPKERQVREILGLSDAMMGTTVAQLTTILLAGDLFGPLISNLPLANWVRMAHEAGLHFRGSFLCWWKLRRALGGNLCRLLIPRSRAEIHQLMEILEPESFHRLLFTREPDINPPWENREELLAWHPVITHLYGGKLPARGRSWHAMRRVALRSSAMNTELNWRMPEWELEVLRQSEQERSLGAILASIPATVPWHLLQQQLYTLHQLLVITLLPNGSLAKACH